MRTLPYRVVSLVLASFIFFGMGRIEATTTWTVTNPPNGDPTATTTAINTALAAAQPGDSVYLPSGAYLINGTLDLQPTKNALNNIRVYGNGPGLTVIKDSGTATSAHAMMLLKNISGTTSPYLLGAELTGITFDGNNSATVSDGVLGGSDVSLWIHNIEVKNMNGALSPHAIRMQHQVTNSTIDYNIISLGPLASNGATGGIWLNLSSSGNTIEHNNITIEGEGIQIDNQSTDDIVRGNSVLGANGERISIEAWINCDDTLIEDNTVDHWISLDTDLNAAVRRNTVISQDDAETHQCCGLEMVGSQDIAFTDNTVNGPGTDVGISMSGANVNQYAFFGYNTLEDCAQWGAQIQGNDDDNPARYVYFYKDSFLDTQNDLPDSDPTDDGHGFRVNEHASFLVLDNCQFNSNAGDGIEVFSAGTTVDELSFYNSTINKNGGSAFNETSFSNFEWTGTPPSGNSVNTLPTTQGFTGSLSAKPSAAISGPATAMMGDTVTFNSDASTDPAGTIGHVLWDLNEGPTQNGTEDSEGGTTASQIYGAPGIYRISLLLWDANGRGAHTETTLSVTGKYEAESTTIPYVTNPSGIACPVFTEGGLSGGAGRVFDATAVGQSLAFTFPNIPAGTYDVKVAATEYPTRGIFQLAIGAVGSSPVTQGPAEDCYLKGTSAPGFLFDLGKWNCTSAGDQVFLFTMVGKNSGSSGYSLALDYIELIPASP